MEVKINRDILYDAIDIYIYEHYPDRKTLTLYTFDKGRLIGQDIKEGDQFPQPSVRLTPQIFKALVESGLDIVPPDKSMQYHLKDAIAIRDRLLTMLEKVN